MKIYTGTGDRGKTSLFSGERIAKSHERIDAYGDVDELNSVVGALAAALADTDVALATELHRVQSDLLAIGAWMATTPGSAVSARLDPLPGDMIQRMEKAIDRLDAGLEPLEQFILPGGHPTAAWAHVARTVCRRAERRLVRLTTATPENALSENDRTALVYLNRLSDYFFVVARHCNRRCNIPETPWGKR